MSEIKFNGQPISYDQLNNIWVLDIWEGRMLWENEALCNWSYSNYTGFIPDQTIHKKNYCRACSNKKHGVKSRKSFPHTCGL